MLIPDSSKPILHSPVQVYSTYDHLNLNKIKIQSFIVRLSLTYLFMGIHSQKNSVQEVVFLLGLKLNILAKL